MSLVVAAYSGSRTPEENSLSVSSDVAKELMRFDMKMGGSFFGEILMGMTATSESKAPSFTTMLMLRSSVSCLQR